MSNGVASKCTIRGTDGCSKNVEELSIDGTRIDWIKNLEFEMEAAMKLMELVGEDFW